MKRRLVWTERAEADLVAIGNFIARESPGAARRWVRALMAKAKTAVEVPFGVRRVPELSREHVREVFLKSYRIVYRVTDRQCEVLTVVEGHRRLEP